MKSIIVNEKMRKVPTLEKECLLLVCEKCPLLKTEECFKCAKSMEKIKKLKAEIARLKKQVKKFKKA